MTNDTAPGRRPSAVQIFGIVGLVLSLILAIGILVGRGYLADQVGGVFDSIDEAVGRGTTVVAMTTGRLEERVADIDAFLADASAVAGNVSIPPALAERATSIADRFAQIRDGWVAVRARIDAALGTLAQIDRALPFVDLPTGPTEELAALDERIAEIDASLTRLRAGATTTLQGVVDGVTALRGVVSRVSEVATRLETGLAAVQDRIDRARVTVENVMWLTTAALLLLVAYIALLNVLLIRRPRRGRLAAATPSPAAAAPSPAAADAEPRSGCAEPRSGRAEASGKCADPRRGGAEPRSGCAEATCKCADPGSGRGEPGRGCAEPRGRRRALNRAPDGFGGCGLDRLVPAALDVGHLSSDVALRVAVGDVATLVVELLPAGQAQLDLGLAPRDVEAKGDDGLAFGLGAAQQLVDLAPVEQQLAGPLRVVVVPIPLLERRDVGADEPGLATLDPGIGVGDIGLARTDRLDLRAGQHEPRLERLVDRELVAGFSVEGDGGVVAHGMAPVG